MKRLNKAAWVLVASGLLISGVAQAALNDRGGGLLYDDVLGVTWLQDAHYAKTSGYDTDGYMTLNTAKSWVANLIYHDTVRNVDYSDWRLPTVSPVNGTSFNYNFGYDGTTDDGFNIRSPASELSYMFYVNLGLKGVLSTTGVLQPNYGLGNGYFGQKDVGLVKNLQNNAYWYSTIYARNPVDYAWGFDVFGGSQDALDQLSRYDHQPNEFYAWAVRDGDVAAVPEPEAYSLLMAGLGLLGFTAHRKSKSGILAN